MERMQLNHKRDIFITINKTIEFLQEALAKTFQF